MREPIRFVDFTIEHAQCLLNAISLWLTIHHSLCMKVPDAFQKLIDNVESTMRHAIVEEENIPMETVTNFDMVSVLTKRP